MRIEEQSAWDRPVPAEEAEENTGRVYWSVEEARWEQYAPELPDDLAGMVAPPVVVAADPVAPAVEPTLHFASAEVDPTLVPAFLAPAPVSPAAVSPGPVSPAPVSPGPMSPAPVSPAPVVGGDAAPAPGPAVVTAGEPVGRRRRRRTRTEDRKPRR